ncbi:PREDICTED: putative tenascin-XA, partial [Pterocles gutturalis]|uniref:putative tenascin-XA n=1 Tax=Pterocles gutturalis TaxID=240206 RepID=UPI000528CA91
LEWSVPEGTFESFTVQYRDTQGQLESLLIDGGSRTVTVAGLSPSHCYNFYLYGLVGHKPPAPPKEEPPSEPRLGELTASQVTPDSVQLQWSVPEGTFDSFTLQYRAAQGQPQVLPVDGGSRTVTVPGLSPSHHYKFNLAWYRAAQGQPQVLPVDGGSRTVTVPGLSPSHHYKFNLYGVWGQERVGPVSTDTDT